MELLTASLFVPALVAVLVLSSRRVAGRGRSHRPA
jgi:hypothetical protein